VTVELAGLMAGLGCLGWGHFVLSFLGAREVWPQRGCLERLTTACLLGLVLVPMALYLGVLLAGPLPVWAGDSLLGAGVLAGLLRLRALGPVASCSERAHGLTLVMLVSLVALGLLAFVASSAAPVHLFDPVFHFAYKGKILWHEGLASGAFTDLDGSVGRVMTHPSYPPLVPSLEVMGSFPLGDFSASAARVLWALFAIAPAVWIAAALEDRALRVRLAGALLWLSLPIIYYYRLPHAAPMKAVVGLLFGPDGAAGVLGGEGWRGTDGASLDAGGDLVVAAFLCGAVVYLGRARRAAGDAWIAGIFLAGAILAKNEGLALSAVLVVALGIGLGARRLLKMPVASGLGAVRALGAALVVSAPWLVYRGRIPAIDESYPELMQPAHVLKSMTADRFFEGQAEPALVTVLREYFLTFTDVLHWNLIWPLFVVALFCALARPRRALERGALLPLLVVAGGLVAFFLILVVTPWHLGRLFTTGIPDRLFLQVAPLAAWGVVAWVFAPSLGSSSDEDPGSARDEALIEVEA